MGRGLGVVANGYLGGWSTFRLTPFKTGSSKLPSMQRKYRECPDPGAL
jgi:hypothetical protein